MKARLQWRKLGDDTWEAHNLGPTPPRKPSPVFGREPSWWREEHYREKRADWARRALCFTITAQLSERRACEDNYERRACERSKPCGYRAALLRSDLPQPMAARSAEQWELFPDLQPAAELFPTPKAAKAACEAITPAVLLIQAVVNP